MHCIYISPHLDDVVLSCGASIYRKSKQGDKVTVITVFTGVGYSQDQELLTKYRKRIHDDLEAGNILCFESIHMGFADAPFRSKNYNSFYNIMFPSKAEVNNKTLIDDMTAKLQDIIIRLKPDCVMFPLGVGGHIDHQLVYKASKHIKGNAEILYYEERPYSFIPGSIASRWLSLGAEAFTSFGDLEQIDWDKINLPFLKNYMANDEDKNISLKILEENYYKMDRKTILKKEWTIESESWIRKEDVMEEIEVKALLKAIIKYSTEIQALFGCEDEMSELEKMGIIKAVYDMYVVTDFYEAVWERV